jgi:hypothetical protein
VLQALHVVVNARIVSDEREVPRKPDEEMAHD